MNAIVPSPIMTPQSERWVVTLRKKKGWSENLAENERRYTAEYSPPAGAAAQPPPMKSPQPRQLPHASPRSDYTTGASLRVDGGVSLRGR